jgi:multidrug efflux pump subunit AcrA (membrane-fusion protein)
VPVQALRFSPGLRRHEQPAATATGDAQSGHARGGKRVWVLADGRLKRVAVTTGLDDGTDVEILSAGLRPGELVVTDTVKQAASSARAPAPRGPRF